MIHDTNLFIVTDVDFNQYKLQWYKARVELMLAVAFYKQRVMQGRASPLARCNPSWAGIGYWLWLGRTAWVWHWLLCGVYWWNDLKKTSWLVSRRSLRVHRLADLADVVLVRVVLWGHQQQDESLGELNPVQWHHTHVEEDPKQHCQRDLTQNLPNYNGQTWMGVQGPNQNE